MEDWLKSKDFQEIDGIWYHFKPRGHTCVVFLEEDMSWTAHLAESVYGWEDHANMLFSCLSEDQAKITLERIIAL